MVTQNGSISKRGRPRKLAGEKKNYNKVTVKMSTLKYHSLKGKAEESGVSLREFVRNSVMNTAVVQRLTPEMHAEIRKLSGMANNLSQISRKANALGYDHIRGEYRFRASKKLTRSSKNIMIAKIVNGGDFAGAVNYILHSKKAAEILVGEAKCKDCPELEAMQKTKV